MEKIIGMAMLLAFGAWSAPAHAQGGSCATPGTMMFRSVPESREDILPSVHKQLAGLGRLAKRGDCSIVVTCVADPGLGEDGKKSRDRSCNAAKAALARYESRVELQDALAGSFSIKEVNADKERPAGAVYVTLE